jgi:aryl-alcohol dehydrogenase-like predicted oxidoreductase
MDTINLGRTGLKVSRICLGTMTYGSPSWRQWVLPEEESRPFIKRALDLGINFFDTADMYSVGMSEEVLGRALRDFTQRDLVVIATKVFNPMGEGINQRGLSRVHIMNAVDASLRRLGTEYIDLYQIHRWDHNTPIEETMEALHDVVKSGKVRYIGASSMYTWQFTKAQYLADLHGWTRFVTMQNHYNLVYREEEREMIPYCQAEGVGIIPWSPLARGFLTGSRHRGGDRETVRSHSDPFADDMYFKDSDFDIVDRVVELAKHKQATPAQIALAWMLHKPFVTAPIIGASKMDHLEQGVQALEIHLSTDEIKTLEELYQPHPVLGHS